MNTEDYLVKQELGLILKELESISKSVDYSFDDLDHDNLLGGPMDNLNRLVDAGKYAIGKYNEVFNKGGVLGDGKQVIIDELSKLNDVFKVNKSTKRPNPPTPPGTPKVYDLSGGERATNVQAAGANPLNINFRTDIKVRTFGDIDLDGNKDFYKTPIVLSRQLLDFSELYKQDVQGDDLVYNEDSVLAQYVQSVLNKLNSIAQQRVNFATSFNYREIANWFSTICNALNVYYGIYSIIQFEQDYNNKNAGMQYIRRNMSAEDFNVLDIFCHDLASTPMPPRFIELFYMMNANYRFEELPKTPIIKFTCADINSLDLLDFKVQDQIKALNDNDFRETCRKIIRTIPNWIGNELPMYGPETYHSRNFNTIFINSGHVVKCNNNNYGYSPTFNSGEQGYRTADWFYLSNVNDLDGLTTTLFSAWDAVSAPSTTEETNKWMTGLFKPKTFSAYANNRAVFWDNALQRLSPTIRHRIPFVNEIDPATNVGTSTGMGINFEQIYGLSPVSLRETSKELIDWMMDLGSIPGREMKSSMDSKPSRSRKRSRGRGKRQSEKE